MKCEIPSCEEEHMSLLGDLHICNGHLQMIGEDKLGKQCAITNCKLPAYGWILNAYHCLYHFEQLLGEHPVNENRNPPSPITKQFETGAVRSKDAESTRYDLISPIAMKALAETYAEGSQKYGDYNWEKGMPVSDLLNHALRHIFLFLSGDRSEPHLPHAMWNLGAAIHSHELWPELNKNLRSEGCKIQKN